MTAAKPRKPCIVVVWAVVDPAGYRRGGRPGAYPTRKAARRDALLGLRVVRCTGTLPAAKK